MTVEIDTPVSEIEGIGPAVAATLAAAIRVYTVLDLVRTPSARLHHAARSERAPRQLILFRLTRCRQHYKLYLSEAPPPHKLRLFKRRNQVPAFSRSPSDG